MSYVSKGEKVFKAQDKANPDCDPPVKPKRSDHRLKRFNSTFDRRAWDLSELERYRYLYDLISGSQVRRDVFDVAEALQTLATCLVFDDFHRIVPIEDIIKILLAEKDAYIKELEEKLRARRGGQPSSKKGGVNDTKGTGSPKKGRSPDDADQAKPVQDTSDRHKNKQNISDQLQSKDNILDHSRQTQPEDFHSGNRSEQSGSKDTSAGEFAVQQTGVGRPEPEKTETGQSGAAESEGDDSRNRETGPETGPLTISGFEEGRPGSTELKEVPQGGDELERGSSGQNKPEPIRSEPVEPEQVRLNEQNLAEELNNSREMLRQAMHKLQNIDEIVNENKKLQNRLRCSEEKIKFLEEKKKRLERELADLRSKSQIQIDLERAQERLTLVNNETPEADDEALQKSSKERDELRKKVEKLEKELEESKKKENELKMLQNQSLSANLDVEEMWRENECYKKKLSSMKNLEEQIQELKRQGRCLADKYKRESQKAAEQMRKMNQAAKELQCLRDERDNLRKRVDELSSLEPQYKALQHKLKCVEEVIAENDMLNSKLMALDDLEKENEYLRCKLGQMEEIEMSAMEDKERILQLQCAVADQEEEMQNLLSQIQKLTSGNGEEELERLKCELFDRDSKLKLCEEQLAEIPMLEAEIDELRTKLQTCCKEYTEKKAFDNKHQKIEIRYPAASKGISAKYKNGEARPASVLGTRREEPVAGSKRAGVFQKIFGRLETSEEPSGGETMSCDEVQNLLQSSKDIITCVLEDMIDHQKEMEELEKCNREMKEEIQILKSKIENGDKKGLIIEVRERPESKNVESSPLKENEDEELEKLREQNKELKKKLNSAYDDVKNLEKLLKEEEEARNRAESLVKSLAPREEGAMPGGDAMLERCRSLQKEIDDLKLQISNLKKLTEELKKENELLRELQKPCPDFSKELDEKCALENLLSLLQAELDAFKGQKLSDECEALRTELKRIMEQNCQLKALVRCYRQRLELEKKPSVIEEEKVLPIEEEAEKGEVEDKGVLLMKPRESDAELQEKGLTGKQESEQIIFMDDLAKKISEEKSFAEKTTEEESKKDETFVNDLAAQKIESAEVKKKSSPKISVKEEAAPEEKNIKENIPKFFETENKEPIEKVPKDEKKEESLPKDLDEEKKKDIPPEPPEEKKEKSLPTKLEEEKKKESIPKIPEEEKKENSLPTDLKEEKKKESIPKVPPEEKKEKSVPKVPPEEKKEESIPKAPPEEKKEESIPKVPPEEKKKQSILKVPPEEKKKESVPTPTEEEKKPPEAKPLEEEKKAPETKEEKQPVKEVPKKEEPQKEPPKAPAEKPAKEPKDESPKAPPTKQEPEEKKKAPEPKTDNKKLEEEKAIEEEGRKAEAEKEDLLKQLEKLKKENKELAAKLAASVADKEKPLKDLEAEFQERLKNLEKENAEKLRKLNEQHGKELADLEKKYNDNMNALKSGYEADIKKMADRHRQSILRLQGLHEDEIRELSTHHENQMETMQTQSEEAINDVAQGSAAKIRRLSQQYEKDLKNAEAKLQKAFRDKEGKYLEEINGLKKSLTKCREELNAQRKKADDSISALKDAHSKEIQKIRRNSAKRLSLVKNKQEEPQEKEKEKKDAEVQTETSGKFKDETPGDGRCECNFGKRRSKRSGDPTTPLDFYDVLEKILDQGLDSLTFNEIALVHRKTCCALEGIVMNSNVSPALEPPVGDGCVHSPLLQEDKLKLMSRIEALENEIVTKQKQNQEDIISMEVAVKKERCRIQELKKFLESEQQKNLELKMLLSSQTKLQSDLRKERDSLGSQVSLHQSLCIEKTKALDQEKKEKKYLEEEVERLKYKVNQLCMALNAARGNAECKQKKDVEQMQMMRLKLEQSANQEHKLAVQLENEARCRMQLQYQLQALRHSFNQMVDLPAVEKEMKYSHRPSESKSAKEKQNLDQVKDKKIKKSIKKHKR